MFRHKETTTDEAPASGGSPEGREKKPEPIIAEPVKAELSLKELIEKNLKWSQIIYEQNRKINNKLLWSAIFSWLKLILIVGPIIFAIIYFQPMLKGVWTQYNQLLGGMSADKGASTQGSLDNLLKLFNLDPAKQEQLKTLLK